RPDGSPDQPDAPLTPTEAALAAIWSEVLGVPDIARTDNFFERGGHSLSLTRMATRLRQQHGIDLPLRTLFEAPTLGALATLVDGHDSGPADAELDTMSSLLAALEHAE
ncbi:phosphopantetheine-binding protein, partial [Methylobacterium sp. J-068]|uniref:phosphopantetheine-binding protein n=1 Tax=Methylobacterium sp. J-068 TaxID=2836649 RepID=UPI001FBBA0E1